MSDQDDQPNVPVTGVVVPRVDWDTLPALSIENTFVSKLNSPVDTMLMDLSSKQSKRTYESRLLGVVRLWPNPMKVREFPWQNLRYEHVVAIKDAMAENNSSPASINATLSAIRKVTKTCVLTEIMSRDHMHNIHEVKMVKASRLPAGREVRVGELELMIRACHKDKHKAARWRDIAVIGFLYICGMRRFEVSSINREDLDLETATLKVKGKGDKERLAYPDPGTLSAVKKWIELRKEFSGPLFLQVKKNGEIPIMAGGISDQAIYNIVQKRQTQAGVKHCAPHDFRRTFGTELLRQGIDLPTVQRLMGHSDPSTTARYDMRDPDEDRRATRGLHLPASDS